MPILACVIGASCNWETSEDRDFDMESELLIKSENAHIHQDGTIHGDHDLDTLNKLKKNVIRDSENVDFKGYRIYKAADHEH